MSTRLQPVLSLLAQPQRMITHRSLLFVLQRVTIFVLTLALVFPPPVLASTFSLPEDLSFSMLWAQIKAAVTNQNPALQDPLERPEPEIKPDQPRENKATLEAKVTKLKSEVPNKLELYVGQRYRLSVVPTDNKGNAVHGLKAEYETSDAKVALVDKDGEVLAGNPGTVTITVKAGNQFATVQVSVLALPKEEKKEKISFRRLGTVRTRNVVWKSKTSATHPAPGRIARRTTKAVKAAVQSDPPPPVMNHDPYATGSPTYRREPVSRTLSAAINGSERPGVSNVDFNVPLVNLPGRGVDASLSLNYNSRVWNYSAPNYYFDEDKNWLAPGFNLGFGKLICYEAYFGGPAQLRDWELIDATGTHHKLNNIFNNGIYYLPDGTQVKGTEFYQGVFMRPLSALLTLTYPNGLTVEYGAGQQTYLNNFTTSLGVNGTYRGIEAYPTKITDRNGNYILINYTNGVGPKIASIKDTLGRYTTFKYATTGELATITVPGYAGGDDRQVARFYYEDLAINASFQNPGPNTSAPGTKKVLKYIYLQSTGAGWKFTYSTYGMIYQIKQLRGMTVSTTTLLDQTGTVTGEGLTAATTTYNYPTVASNLSTIPQYTQRTDDWAGNTNGGPAVYTFTSFSPQGLSTSTDPYGVVTETQLYTTGSYAGFVAETRTLRNSALLAKTAFEYVGFAQIQKVTSTITTGPGTPKSRTTEYGYDTYSNVNLVIEKGYDGNEIRSTETTYETGTGWINRNLLNLPKTVLVKNAGGTVLARTDFVYDKADTGVSGTNLVQRSNVSGCDDIVGHRTSYDPYACLEYLGYSEPDPNDPDCAYPNGCAGQPGCDGVCTYQPVYGNPYYSGTAYRGNVTKVKRWAKPAVTEAASLEANETNFTYDIAGNMVTATASCCNLKTYTYVKGNEYAFPTQVARGTSGQLTTQATYDFNTSLTRTSVDENGRTTTFDYYNTSLRPYQTTRPDGGKTQNIYYDQLYATPDANHLNSYVLTRVYTAASSYANTYQFFNGIGQATRSLGHYSVASTATAMSDVEYDLVGRPLRRNNPYYGASGRLAPIGQAWTYTYSDDLNRVTSVVAPDNTTMTINYNGSTTLGTVQTVTDQAGKQRRSITDALGRLLEVQEPDATGSVGADASVPGIGQRTTYQYDALDNLIKTTQTSASNETQNRYFKYDGLSRLTHERQVEQDAPHAQTDTLTGNNNWSKKIAYDLQGKVVDTWDARGTNTHFTYDALNRLATVGYSGGTPTVATPTVTYTYDTAASGYYNLGRLTEVKTAASTTPAIPETKIQYNYDQMGRVATHNQIVAGITYPMSYGYNLAGQLTAETYPSNRVVNYNYQTGYGLTSVADASRTYVSGITYTAHGAISSETLGNGAVQAMAFNNRLQLSQINLTKSGTELQRYDYDYGQYDATNTTLDATKNNGQIAKIEGFIGGTKQWEQRHTYDELGRLKVAGEYRGDNGQVSWRAQYGYDRFGNRYQDATMTLNTGLSYVAVQNADVNRTTNRFASIITYDGGGNVLTDNKFKANFSYAYDANNRVVSTNNGAMTAVYDGAGQRVRATDGSGTTTSVYDGAGDLIAEYNGTTLIREYIGNFATVEGTTVRYLMNDHLGSNRVVMNDTGGVVVRHDYLPYGEEIAATMGMRSSGQGYGVTDWTRTKFAGMERETANGLDHTLYRKAENKSGRWNSPDPYLGSMIFSDPQSLNRYHYVQNDPLNAFDPDGRIPHLLAAMLISGLVAGAIAFVGTAYASSLQNNGKVNWKAAMVAGAVGFAAGFLAPLIAWHAAASGGSIILRQALLGMTANLVQTTVTSLWDKGTGPSKADVVWAMITGVITGLIGGATVNSTFNPNALSSEIRDAALKEVTAVSGLVNGIQGFINSFSPPAWFVNLTTNNAQSSSNQGGNTSMSSGTSQGGSFRPPAFIGYSGIAGSILDVKKFDVLAMLLGRYLGNNTYDSNVVLVCDITINRQSGSETMKCRYRRK